MRGLAGNLIDLTMDSSQCDILFFSETFSLRRHVSELLVPGFGRPVLLCQGKTPRARGIAADVRDGYTEHFANPNLSVIVAKCWFLGFVM